MKAALTILLLALPFALISQGKATPENWSKHNTRQHEIKSTGVMYEYMVLNNKINGKISKYHDNVLVEEGWAFENKEHSTWKSYTKEGKTKAEASYMRGKKHGTWKIWDDNGTLRYQYQYNKGKRTGNWKMFSETGELVQSRNY